MLGRSPERAVPRRGTGLVKVVGRDIRFRPTGKNQMQQLPQFVQGRLTKGAAAGQHPDPDLLTAFAARALSDGDRGLVLDHLSRCGDCREVLALALPENAPIQVRPRPRLSGLPALRWAPVAAVLVVGAAIGLHYTKKAPPESARLAAPVQPPSAQKVETAAKPELTAKLDVPVKPELAARPQAREPHATDNLEKKSNAATPSVAARRDDSFADNRPAAPASAGALSGAAAEQADVQAEPARAEAKPSSDNEIAEAAPAKDAVFAGKAKQPVRSTGAANMAGGTAHTMAKQAVALSAPAVPTPRWTLSADGTLQRSLDSGQTWANVAVPTSSTLRALAASGPEIWVGGSAGALYHSSDAGSHWTQVRPTSVGKSLTADIIGVEFTDPQHGKITAANQEIWTTADGGQNWQSH